MFKKCDVHIAKNYHPVSLTSVTCKLLEHICKHILTYLENNNIQNNLNYDFCSSCSCETRLLLMKAHKQMLSSSFSKAFDTVPHEELLTKLESFGITESIHHWLRTFLTKRYMQVVVDGESSSKVAVDSGAPQGTVFGLLLFLCHINDLPLDVSSQVRLFTDDCLLYTKIKSKKDHTILPKDLMELEKWVSE